MTLLPLSISIGLVVGLLFTDVFGIAAGGLIVPGYVALFLDRPWTLAATLAVALLTFGAVKALASFAIVFGRRRSALMILVGFLLGGLARQALPATGTDAEVIGFIIPGLIAIWMDRQGVVETLSGLAIVSVLVRLVLVLVAGDDLAVWALGDTP